MHDQQHLEASTKRGKNNRKWRGTKYWCKVLDKRFLMCPSTVLREYHFTKKALLSNHPASQLTTYVPQYCKSKNITVVIYKGQTLS